MKVRVAAPVRRPESVLARRILFGETDAAGVVFYPNYLRWFDQATHELFRAIALPLKRLEQEEGFVLPVMSIGAEFKRALNYDDEIEIRSRFADISEKSFKVIHSISRGGEIVSNGWEIRAWATVRNGTFQIVRIPESLRARLE